MDPALTHLHGNPSCITSIGFESNQPVHSSSQSMCPMATVEAALLRASAVLRVGVSEWGVGGRIHQRVPEPDDGVVYHSLAEGS